MNDGGYEDLTILVNSCDAYDDVWDLYFSAFQEHASCLSNNIVLNTESKHYNNKILDVKTTNYLNKNKDQWGERLLHALSEIKTEYVLMVCEDYILESAISEEKLQSCLSFMRSNKEAAVIYLVKVFEDIVEDSGFDFEELKKYVDYKVNSAAAIWRKADLIRYVGSIDSPWAWEYFGSYRSYFDGKKFYQVSKQDSDLYHYNYSLGGAIYRGKWVRDVVEEKIKKYKLPININERGVADLADLPKRSAKWKIDFFCLGYRMIGFPVALFFFRALSKKILHKMGCS